jgi:cullin 3
MNLVEGFVAHTRFPTPQDIKNSTLIPDPDLQRQLQTLACAKFKILKKHPPSRDISTEDSFSFNSDFTSPLHKIKISTIASKVETQEERKETQDRIEEERKQQADVSGNDITDGFLTLLHRHVSYE